MEVTSGNLTHPEFESLTSSSRSCPLHKELRIVRIEFSLVHTKAYLSGLDKICKFLKSQLPHLYIEGIVLIYLPNPFQFCMHYESQQSVVVKIQVLEIKLLDSNPDSAICWLCKLRQITKSRQVSFYSSLWVNKQYLLQSIIFVRNKCIKLCKI